MEGAGGWIADVEFPATKLELIDAASDRAAAQEEIERLQQLVREQYASRAELEAELGADSGN